MTLFPEGWAQARPPTASLSLITAGNAAAWSSAKQSTFRPSFFHVRVLSLGVFLIASTFETQVTVVCTCVHMCVLVHKLVCCIHVCVHLHVCTCMPTHKRICHVCVRTCTCARVCVLTHKHVCVVCVRLRVCTCVLTHKHVCCACVCVPVHVLACIA